MKTKEQVLEEEIDSLKLENMELRTMLGDISRRLEIMQQIIRSVPYRD